MNNKHFYKYYENKLKPLCIKDMKIFYLTQALSLCVYYDLYDVMQ
jgi:hypothetical protein